MTRNTDEKISDLQIRMNEVWKGVGLAQYVCDGQFEHALEGTIRRVLREDERARQVAFWREFRFYLPWLLLVIGGTAWIVFA